MMKKDLYFITGNKNKFEFAEKFFKKSEDNNYFNLIQLAVSTPEIQSDSVEQIALYSAQWAYDQLKKPVIKSDAGLYIEALRGFPGPFMKYINDWLSQGDLLRLMGGKTDRKVIFRDALTFVFEDIKESFVSDTEGTIAENEATEAGSAVDQLFVPVGHDKSLVQLSKDDRRDVWNVDRWDKLLSFLVKNYDRL